jgi:hypothetical protein
MPHPVGLIFHRLDRDTSPDEEGNFLIWLRNFRFTPCETSNFYGQSDGSCCYPRIKAMPSIAHIRI